MRSCIIFSVLVLQASASFFNMFTPVEQSFGRLVTDVVTDIKDTIDCTLMAVENVLSIGGMFGDYSQYQEKCNGQKYPQDPQTQVNSVSPMQTYTVDEEPVGNTAKQEITQEIDESVSKASEHIKNLLEQSHASEKIENVKNSLKNETDRLVQISKLLSQELHRLPETMRRKFEFKEDRPSIENLLAELKLLFKVEQKDKSSAQANEVRRTFDKVLDILHVPNSNKPLSDEDEVKEIVRYLGKMTNDSIVDVEKQVEEWSEEQNNKLEDIKTVVLNTNNESQAKISKINDSEEKNKTEAVVTKVLNEKLDEIEKAQEQIIGFSGTLKDLAKNILDKVSNSSAPDANLLDLKARGKLDSDQVSTTESKSQSNNIIQDSKKNEETYATVSLPKQNNQSNTMDQTSASTPEKNEDQLNTESNTSSSNLKPTNVDVKTNLESIIQATTQLNPENSKVKETNTEAATILKDDQIDSAGLEQTSPNANLKSADTPSETSGLLQSPLPYLQNSSPQKPPSSIAPSIDRISSQSYGETSAQSFGQTSSQSSPQSKQTSTVTNVNNTETNYSEKGFTQSQTSSTSQTSASSTQSLNSSTQMGNTSLQSTPISQSFEKSSETQSNQTGSQKLASITPTSSVSQSPQQDQPTKNAEATRPTLPKSFKELAEKLFEETTPATTDDDIPFDESFLDPSFFEDYFDDILEDGSDQVPPELSVSLINKLFGSQDPVDKKAAVEGAKNLIEESKHTNTVLNNIFNHVDRASAPNVFDNPQFSNFGQEGELNLFA